MGSVHATSTRKIFFLESEVQHLGKKRRDPIESDMLSGYSAKHVHNKVQLTLP